MNISTWPIAGTLRGTTTLDQSGHESNGNEGALHISQRSRTENSPSDGLVSYPGYWMENRGFYLSEKMLSANWDEQCVEECCPEVV